MTKCIFCGDNIPMGTGMMFVKNDGKILYFCGRQCEKNMMKLGRKSRNVKWTADARAEKKANSTA